MKSIIKRISNAVLSFSRSAYLGMTIIALSPFTRLLDRLLPKPAKTGKDKLPPCLIIVSPPRSGSTIMYQVLVRAIPCVYYTNLHVLFPDHASVWLLKKDKFGQKLGGYNNYYGYTSSLNDVNEGNEIFENLYRDTSDPNEIRSRFIKFLNTLDPEGKRPVILKNVRTFEQMELLAKAVPEVKFLRIRRNLADNIQSELRAYYEAGTFHPLPSNLSGIDYHQDPVDFAVRQILEMHATFDRLRSAIPADRWIDWTYEDFCEHTAPMIRELARDFLGVDENDLRQEALAQTLKPSTRRKVSPEEEDQINKKLEQLKPIEQSDPV